MAKKKKKKGQEDDGLPVWAAKLHDRIDYIPGPAGFQWWRLMELGR
jgi:hypothetical protein